MSRHALACKHLRSRRAAGGAASPPFPQPRALGTALQEAQVTLLGSLLAVVSQQNQLQILDLLATAAAAPTSKSRDRDAPGVRRGIVTAVCCAALAGLVVLARPQRGEQAPIDASCLCNSLLSLQDWAALLGLC